MSQDQDAPAVITSEPPFSAAPVHNNDIQALSGSPVDIPLELKRDEDVGDLNPDEIVQANPQWGSVAMLANAASFDSVVPSAVAAAYGNLFWNVERNGEFSLSNGGGSLETTFLQMFGILDENGKPKGDGDGDGWSDYAEAQERRAETQHDIEARWSAEEHELGGVTMTGEEWGDLGNELRKDGTLRRSLIDRLMKQGRTRQEAEQKETELADIATIMGKPESTWTPEEREKIERAKTDPAYTDNAQWLKDARQEVRYGAANNAEMSSTRADQKTSIQVGSDLLDKPFPNAPNVQEDFQVAAVGSEKSETKPDVKVAAAPLPAAQPAASGGFDV